MWWEKSDRWRQDLLKDRHDSLKCGPRSGPGELGLGELDDLALIASKNVPWPNAYQNYRG